MVNGTGHHMVYGNILSYIEPQCKSTELVSAFVYPNISDCILNCVKLHIFFFNMLLMLINLGAIMWMKRQPRVNALQTSWSDLHKKPFNKNNLKRSAKSCNPHLHIVMALNLLSAMMTHDTFNLVSDSALHQKLTRYRGYQGMLDTTKLPTTEWLA